MSWLFSAFGVAVCWGVVYALTGKLLHSFSSYSILIFYSVCTLIVFLPIWVVSNTFITDYKAFMVSSRGIQISFVIAGILTVAASYMLYDAIEDKNATLASLVEITYPIFTIVFTYLLYREFALTLLGTIGVFVVFIGLFMVVLGAK